MQKLYIIKTGTTFPDTKGRLGDFDQWTARALGSIEVDLGVVDAEHGASLPKNDACAGVVITGSHAMVTDNVSWRVELEKWTVSLLKAQIPLFGICYGHQLLAQAAGGKVGFHPRGREIGTVSVARLPVCANDPVFQGIPKSFLAHATHLQTVLDLPKAAIGLAANPHEPHHAFRLGPCAWGVQFHPEYTAEIMRAYIREQTNDLEPEGLDVSQLLKSVAETPIAAQVLKRFGRFVADRQAHQAAPPAAGKGHG